MSDTPKAEPKKTTPETSPLALRYIGAGATLPDVPARDLTVDEWSALVQDLVERSARAATEDQPSESAADIRKAILASGLYEKAGS
jgi:hypothetical protein